MRALTVALFAGLVVLPCGLSRAEAEAAQTPPGAGPAPGQPDRNATIDRLLATLKTAQTEQEATIIESHVLKLWIDGASPASRLLVARGVRELEGGAKAEAVEDFNALVVLEPTLPEAYHQRALARYAAGDSNGAILDIERTLQLEPRHFPALSLLSRIAEGRGDWQTAYQAWRKVLALDPKAPGGEARLNMLRVKALGRDT